MSTSGKFALPDRYRGSEKNLWVESIQLALEYKPLNLGQGFPDFAPPQHLSQALAEVASDDNFLFHQYTRNFGHPSLVKILAQLYSKMINREINPFTEVLITAGAMTALLVTIYGHLNPGDEAIVIEPAYDCYDPMIRSAGGIPVCIPLQPTKKDGDITSGDWKLDEEKLRSLFNSKTKMIIVNTPQNPLGKVFTRKELELIAELCQEHNVLCVADEVYEWLVYKPNEHIRMATLPGMWDRTITIGSAGKTFSVTGWKIGWAYGPASLLRNLQIAHQTSIHACSTPMQEALARSFELELARFDSPDCYLKSLAVELEAKRAFMVNMLKEVGMRPVIPEGGYFIMADWTPLERSIDFGEDSDRPKDNKFTTWMIQNIGLQGIPTGAFYATESKHLGENFVRFCFCKKDTNLSKAEEILKKWKLTFTHLP